MLKDNFLENAEALDDRTPSDVYTKSPRSYPTELPDFVYPAHWVVRRVHRNGVIKWAGREIFLSEAVDQQLVALQQISNRLWSVRLGPLELAILDDETHDFLKHDRLVWTDEQDE